MRHRKHLRIVGGALGVLLALIVLLWVGIRHTFWLGPWLADTGRAIAGPTFVARVEDLVYAAEERWNRLLHSQDPPRQHWEAAPVGVASATASGSASAPVPGEQCEFPPRRVEPLHARFEGVGDGVWTPISHARAPSGTPSMYKTVIHPDAPRPFAAVAIVAIDLSRLTIHLEPGMYVPEDVEPEARGMSRPGLIPAAHQKCVIAAFNGGFKSVHGRLGMHVRGTTLVRAQPWGCTVVKQTDGRILIDAWSDLPGSPAERSWWRQAPQCLVAKGAFGKGVLADENTNWGSSIAGSTYIRRSAIGMDKGGHVLLVGIGDPVTAGGMARAMKQAGADTVAQLDVNWSLPKFLFYVPETEGSEKMIAEPLYPGLIHFKGEYLRDASARDFFYITPEGC